MSDDSPYRLLPLITEPRIVTALTAYCPISRSRIPWFLLWVFGNIRRSLHITFAHIGWVGKKSLPNIIGLKIASEKGK